jgi:general secretion pathway protein G
MARHLSRRDLTRERGLTLIELVLVIALVAILASLAASGWGGYQNRIKTKTAVEEITAISMVIDQYYADNNAFPADLAAIGRGGLRDPWGNAYAYLDLTSAKGKGKARKDHSLVPLNSATTSTARGRTARARPR